MHSLPLTSGDAAGNANASRTSNLREWKRGQALVLRKPKALPGAETAILAQFVQPASKPGA